MNEKDFLENYNENEYARPSVAVDVIVMTIGDKAAETYRKLNEKTLQVLLVKRKEHPYKNKWSIPGGFADITKTLQETEETAIAKLKDKTGVDNAYMEQLYTWSAIDRDPRTRVVSTSYLALIEKQKSELKAGATVQETAWFDVSLKEIISTETERIMELTLTGPEVIKDIIIVKKVFSNNIIDDDYSIKDNSNLAFDHAKIIAYAVERLRSKMAYTPIACKLLGEQFTIAELQQVYTCILDKQLIGANFRRKVMPFLTETTDSTADEGKGHRPAKYYKLDTSCSLF